MTDTELYPDFKSLNKIINILDHEKIKIKEKMLIVYQVYINQNINHLA